MPAALAFDFLIAACSFISIYVGTTTSTKDSASTTCGSRYQLYPFLNTEWS